MILGSVTITPRAVQTHKDSYLLRQLSVVSIRRPFLPGALIFGFGGGAFTAAFSDLMYPHEIVCLTGTLFLGLIAGFRIGHIQLLSRDLRGTELSGMIWGSYGHLNRIRRDIFAALPEDAS